MAYPPTNTVILTDSASNIRRVLSILEAIDVETYKEELAVIKVSHADASVLGQQLADVYGAEVRAPGKADCAQPVRASPRYPARRSRKPARHSASAFASSPTVAPIRSSSWLRARASRTSADSWQSSTSR